MTDEELRARLDTLEAQNAALQTTLDNIIEMVSGLVTEAKPILDKMTGSPLLKMLGGK